jgi:hypothetical protein
MKKQIQQRLESLDVLRGFDLFCLVAFGKIVHKLADATQAPVFDSILPCFDHVHWEGSVRRTPLETTQCQEKWTFDCSIPLSSEPRAHSALRIGDWPRPRRKRAC